MTTPIVTLDVEKPAAGGRMVARHDGQVVLVSGAIPGERVAARVERAAKHVLYADTVEVLVPSPDRRTVSVDWRCGGNVFAHVAYPRQLQLKSEILCDAFARIGRMPLPAPPPVVASPEQGYRMRARLHVRGGRIGFMRDGTHDLCPVGPTGQMLPEAVAWMEEAASRITRHALRGLASVEMAENIPGTERACHLEVEGGADLASFAALAGAGVTGLSAQIADRHGVAQLSGTAAVSDVLAVSGATGPALRLRRDARAFFQGNRFLLETLVRQVADAVPDGPVLDLYAGVGLFGLALAAAGSGDVTMVEGHPHSARYLAQNAEPFVGRVRVSHSSVEDFLQTSHPARYATCLVDPPRTGVSKEAIKGLVQLGPGRITYVSCDPATLARDARILVDAGYALEGMTGLDLFPNTAHVEAVAVFQRQA